MNTLTTFLCERYGWTPEQARIQAEALVQPLTGAALQRKTRIAAEFQCWLSQRKRK